MLINWIKSPLIILPSFPEPLIFFISILFSSTIFLTAGERVWLLPILTILGFVFISLLKTKGFSQATTLADPTLDLTEVYVDKFELSEALKMKENKYYFIDHPYFGIILKISLWKKRKIN